MAWWQLEQVISFTQEENIEELKKIRGPYDVNMFAKVAILAALQDLEHMKDYVREVMESSKPKVERFLKERGVSFYPSSANFLLLKVAEAEELVEKLKEKGILVRPKKDAEGKKAVRVSIGGLQDTERFIKSFGEG